MSKVLDRIQIAIGVFSILIVIPAIVIGSIAISVHDKKQETIVVNQKQRVLNGVTSDYFVYTSNQVFKLKDTIWLLHFNTHDVWNQLAVDKSCLVTSVGMRVPFLGEFRNIVSVESCQSLPQAKLLNQENK